MAFQTKSNHILLITAAFLFSDILVTPINADGISCFRCFISQLEHKETNLLCSQFDGSARFQVYCPSSTVCRKRTIHHKFKDSIVTAVERDCAPQQQTVRIYDSMDDTWQNDEEIVKTAYEEGCFIGEDRGAPGGPPEYCFCSFHLCNSSQSCKTVNIYTIFLLTIILLCIKSL